MSDFAAQRRIRAAVPHARLIAVLRDPVDHAYSNWAHLWADGLEPVGDFMAACAEEERRAAAGWARFRPYKALGRYGEQPAHLFDALPTCTPPEQAKRLRQAPWRAWTHAARTHKPRSPSPN